MACLTSGAMILTSSGYKQIQNLQESDNVIAYDNMSHSNGRADKQEYAGTVVSIKSAANTNPIHATTDLPFLTKTITSTGFGESEFVLSPNTSWTPAIGLKAGKHMLCLPIEQSSKSVCVNIEVDGQRRTSSKIDWFMVGFYVGKGTHAMDVNFIPPGWNILREFTSNPNGEVAICDYIPEWVQRLPINEITSFLNGFEKSSAIYFGFIVINEIVALSMQRLYAKLNLFVAIDMSSESVILCPITDTATFDDNYMYIPIEHVGYTQKNTIVYNLQDSYIVENAAVRDNQ